MLKRTHKFELSNVEASIKKHPKMWIGLSFISTFLFVVDGFSISLDLSKGIPVKIDVPDDYEVKEGEDAFFNDNITFVL